jgi:UV DNA damage endonuclease
VSEHDIAEQETSRRCHFLLEDLPASYATPVMNRSTHALLFDRIDTIKQKGIKYVQELARRNLEDLLHIIQWNEDNVLFPTHPSGRKLIITSQNIRFMRISSDIFPFASHTEYGYPLTHFLPLMSTIGELAQKYGHRLTTHPGQYVQLGSPTEKVLQASVRELKHHCDFLEGMGVGKDGVCIVHVSETFVLHHAGLI